MNGFQLPCLDELLSPHRTESDLGFEAFAPMAGQTFGLESFDDIFLDADTLGIIHDTRDQPQNAIADTEDLSALLDILKPFQLPVDGNASDLCRDEVQIHMNQVDNF